LAFYIQDGGKRHGKLQQCTSSVVLNDNRCVLSKMIQTSQIVLNDRLHVFSKMVTAAILDFEKRYI